MGACLFCPACAEACPEGAVRFTGDHRLAARTRADLVAPEAKLATVLEQRMRKLFGRSLRLRQVCAGGCSGRGAEPVALGTVVFDLGRFGVQFVASPRHADGVVVTGPVTDAMRQPLLDTWAATPAPKLVIAVGACAIAGGPFAGPGPHANGIPPEL